MRATVHSEQALRNSTSSMQPPTLILRDITKTFPGVVANDHVTLEVRAGEVHALLGENGAGKTTLMKILYGIYQPEAGEILIRGRPAHIRSPRDAIARGVGMVPQHFLLVRRHTVVENVALGLPGTPFLFPLHQVEQKIQSIADRYGLAVAPRAAIWQLSAGEQQRVEILKALIRGAEILVLDEPTSVLTPQEARGLFKVLHRMKEEGHAIVFITHKLDEVMEIADRVTVLRKGRVVDTIPTAKTDAHALALMMVGREVEFRPAKAPRPPQGEVLAIEGLWANDDRGLPALRNVALSVRQGEILGVAGVAGNGQRELVEVITGLRPAERGRVQVLGKDLTNRSAREIFEAGLAHIPEDRLRMGVVPAMSVAQNLALRRYRYPPFSRGPLLDLHAIVDFARQMILEYGIATPGPQTPVRSLSGGNIQKLILARELAEQPTLIVAVHPTFGLDVAATQLVHTLLLHRREAGTGVLLVSEDLDEILVLSDRIAVMFGGEIIAILSAPTATPEQVGLLMAGERV